MATTCGEFGSVGLALNGHEWKPEKGVSGIMVPTANELEETYEGYITMLSDFKVSNGMSGAVFTQLTDVEQEINGFLSYDRVSKVDISKIKAINEKLIHQTITGKEALLPNATTAAQDWKYTTAQPAQDWMKPDFNDAAWSKGNGGFGAGAPPGSVVNTEWKTGDIWLRKHVELGTIKAADLKNLAFYIYHDDDCEVYLNGVLAASIKRNSSSYVLLPLNDAAQKALKSNMRNTIAVHCHQTGGGQYIDVGVLKLNYSPDSGK